MARFDVTTGAMLVPSDGCDRPILDVRFNAVLRKYQIVRYRDQKRVNSDPVNQTYPSATLAYTAKVKLEAEFAEAKEKAS